MADALKAFPRESNVFKERFPSPLPLCGTSRTFRSGVPVEVTPHPHRQSSATRVSAVASSTLWRILFGFVVVLLTSWRGRGSGKTPPQGGPARQGAGRPVRSRPDPEGAAADERAAEPGRGREADTPTEIPAGWKDILWRIYEEIKTTASWRSRPA